MPLRVTPARRSVDIEAVRRLLWNYFEQLRAETRFTAAAEELAQLPSPYVGPRGALLIAWSKPGQAVGCAGLRPLEQEGACELKRLYVAEAGRGQGVGRALVTAAMTAAIAAGYSTLYLDTLPTMTAAASLYRSLGFEPVPCYHPEATPDLLCFRKVLA